MEEVVGIDEVGRGSWAGPVVAGAVLLKRPISGLADSKTLTANQRKKLSKIIYQHGIVGLGWSSALIVDKYGITEAIRRAMQQALNSINQPYKIIIIDGDYNFLSDIKVATAYIKADMLYPAVSAASIVAKVARDKYMVEQSIIYPGYSFEKHKGYGTNLHNLYLKKNGPCIIHRRSFKPVGKVI